MNSMAQSSTQSHKPKVKIRNSNELKLSKNTQNAPQLDAHHFSFQQSPSLGKAPQNQSKQKQKRVQNHYLNPLMQPWQKPIKKSQQLISLPDMVRKLQKTSYSILQNQYSQSFVSNQDHFSLLTKLQSQSNFDKLLYAYTSTLIEIVQYEQQQRFNYQPKHKIITLNRQDRIKLKLVLSENDEDQLSKMKNKSFQTYVKKIEEECEKHKREHVRIKERNRILESEMLKISLEFKNKRELYINEITRLTDILHSSFMEVGKMFVNLPNPMSKVYNSPQNTPNAPQIDNYDARKIQYQNLMRKNVKSLSPKRRAQNIYPDVRPLDFLDGPKRMISLTENYMKPQSSHITVYRNGNQNLKQPSLIRQQSQNMPRLHNRFFDASSQQAKQDKILSSPRNNIYASSVTNNKRSENF